MLVTLPLDAGVLDALERAEVVESVAETESDPVEAALEVSEVAAEVAEPESVKQLESPGEKNISFCGYADGPVHTARVHDERAGLSRSASAIAERKAELDGCK